MLRNKPLEDVPEKEQQKNSIRFIWQYLAWKILTSHVNQEEEAPLALSASRQTVTGSEVHWHGLQTIGLSGSGDPAAQKTPLPNHNNCVNVRKPRAQVLKFAQ